MFITYSLEPIGIDTKLTYEIVSDKHGYLGLLGKFLEKLYFRRMIKKKANTESIRQLEKHFGKIDTHTKTTIV